MRPPARPGGAVPSAGAVGPAYSDRIELGGNRSTPSGSPDPAPPAAGSPDAGAPWDAPSTDTPRPDYGEYGTATPADPAQYRRGGEPGGSGGYEDPGGPGASGGRPGSYRGPHGAGAHGGPSAPGGVRESGGPGPYGGPGGSGSPGGQGASGAQYRHPHADASRADSLPGAAAYGGSLPGVRPGASIAVPVDAHTVPAPRDEPPVAGGAQRHPGPSTRLAAERARQTRMQVVGPVTERWAPEQAGPIHEHWQLAPPVGPAADLWALGALLFRAVQGHPAYPEEDVGELVQLVCSEPAAHAEDCGALRPVVESLLRQDPTERPDFEELRGWLRSLIRTAPEPGIGSRTVTVPQHSTGRRADPRRLPILRRRGELMRRRRAAAPVPVRSRHRRRSRRGPRSLGRTLIALIFVAMAGAIAYAAMFMPQADEGTGTGAQRSVVGGGREDEPRESAAPSAEQGDPNEPEERDEPRKSEPDEPKGDGGQNGASADLPDGFELRKDPAGFEVAVREDWQRVGENDRGQIRYVGGDYELVIVPGRDGVGDHGSDPMAYQQESEPELAAFRDAAWSTASGLRRIDVGQRAMAEGEFTWSDSSGRQVHAKNLAMILEDTYHVVLLIGPEQQDAAVERFHRVAAESYRPTG